MIVRFLLAMFAVMVLSACTGLQQFPEHSKDYKASLKTLDPDYETALNAINEAHGNLDEQKRIRNEEIDRRLAVIDANFREFEVALAKENVTAEFLVAVVGVGVGGAGALVGETASQILSAVSGGLAGAQAAYGKAALYEKALSALLSQMIAGRKTVLVLILERRKQSIDNYPLSAAIHDLDAYYFAGSLPGAIVSTAADAKVKDDEATILLGEITKTAVSEKRFRERKDLRSRINELTGAQAKELILKIPEKFPDIEGFVEDQYPDSTRNDDESGDAAKAVLRRMVLNTVYSDSDTETWQAAIDDL
ncbi:MAG: hypothetical protein AAF495_28175 [Pseudomonadota bacterium]